MLDESLHSPPFAGRLPNFMTRVLQIESLDELENFRLAWSALLAQTRGATFFQSLDWLSVYWRHFGGHNRLRVLVVRSDDETLGILPLVLKREPTRLGRLPALVYPLDSWGTFYGPIGPLPSATLAIGLRHVHEQKRDWSMIDLRWVHRDGVDFGRTPSAMAVAGFPATETPHEQVSLVDLTAGWDAYWSSRKSHWRTNVRSSIKKLTALGDVRYVRYRPGGTRHGEDDPRWDLYDACEQLAQESWQGHSTTGTTLSHAAIRDFLRDAHGVAAAAGALDLNLLYLGGEPVAFNYNYVLNGYVYGLRMGWAGPQQAAGAGSVLMYHMLRDSAERGDATVDLGPSYLDCKRPWLSALHTSYRYTYFSAEPRAQLLRMKRMMNGWLPHKAEAAKAE
jgi:CelD/BcsL family acetyltransferase involved in cellulose biosynthesis